MFKNTNRSQPLIYGIIKTNNKLLVSLFYISSVILGSFILWSSAKFHVPFYPVPMTMQTLFVLLIGAVYGPFLAISSVATYLTLGIIGLPVFAGSPERGLGLDYILGPTGGFLVGFLLAVLVVGFLFKKPIARNFLGCCLSLVIGDLIIFISGWLWLSYLLDMKTAFTLGVLPFLIGDGLKILLASLILPILIKNTDS